MFTQLTPTRPQPIPLEFLRLGQFDQPSETRKEKSDGDSILDNLRYHTRPQYPFTIYHAAAKSTRRYTLYTNSEAAREKWRKVLSDTIAIHAVRRDANQVGSPFFVVVVLALSGWRNADFSFSGLHLVRLMMVCFGYEVCVCR